jgi:hypothetical protein
MFVGHYTSAFVAAAHPKAPGLGTLFVAAQLVDIAFFAFVPLGIEAMRVLPGISAMNPMDLYHLPYTHSLLGAVAWGLAFAAVPRLWIGNWTAGLIGGAVVVSHWFLDLLVHVPDLTLAGAAPKLGFGLWNHPAIAMPLELALIGGSAWLYARRTRAIGRPWLLPALFVLLLVFQAINWFGPPPQAVDVGLWGMALFAFAVLTLFASWVARNRVPR